MFYHSLCVNTFKLFLGTGTFSGQPRVDSFSQPLKNKVLYDDASRRYLYLLQCPLYLLWVPSVSRLDTGDPMQIPNFRLSLYLWSDLTASTSCIHWLRSCSSETASWTAPSSSCLAASSYGFPHERWGSHTEISGLIRQLWLWLLIVRDTRLAAS